MKDTSRIEFLTLHEIKVRTPMLIGQLETVWEKSVRTTHLFLSEEEIMRIKRYVPQALMEVPHLIAAERNQSQPIAFMGIENSRLEMLFISPEERGRGLGRMLLEYGILNYGINEVTVNEQNPQAVGFYRYMGFKEYKRTDFDEEGYPYPLLYMKLHKTL